jgi:hypothetical protein
MYHAAWEVGELTDLARARERLIAARSLVGQSDPGTSLSLYPKDPDGLEFELSKNMGAPKWPRLFSEGGYAPLELPRPDVRSAAAKPRRSSISGTVEKALRASSTSARPVS